GRRPFHRDALEAQIVAGAFTAPVEGDALTLPDGAKRLWEAAEISAAGEVKHDALRNGYAYFSLDSPREYAAWLDAAGPSTVYVNGEPRAGDTYVTGRHRIPILIQKGANHFLFVCRRGVLRIALYEADPAVSLNLRDLTAPDLLVGEPSDAWAGVVVVNATSAPLEGARVVCTVEGAAPAEALLPVVPAMSVRKVPVPIRAPAFEKPGRRETTIAIHAPGDDESLVTGKVVLNVRSRDQVYKRTFISAIDGSVQYYAARAPQPPRPTDRAPALFLSLHGAAVEATNQAASYAPKAWGALVAPTNRRAFGFDWEDWGRLDALEVLEHARREFAIDPSRVYLTGHSMGGHGAWSLGALFPSRFAAIGPSAGWISFDSYARRGGAWTGDPHFADLLRRAAAASDTLAHLGNYRQQGVYILHGDDDDNVPVEQARRMRDRLDEFHRDVEYYEQRGAGHWWDNDPEEGAACVDFTPMFQFFARHAIPDDLAMRQIDFTTVNPAISSDSHWLRIESQHEALLPSRARIQVDPVRRVFFGTTINVERLRLDASILAPGKPFSVELDGQTPLLVEWDSLHAASPAAGGDDAAPRRAVYLRQLRKDGMWETAGPLDPTHKGPHRGGPFKQVFDRRMVYVYGTQGSAEENAWAQAKARYDAETFYYRGNGAVDVVADTAFEAARYADRNVVLYGNKDTNAAWNALLGRSPVYVGRGIVVCGEHVYKRDDLAVMFVRPRPDSATALVGVVGGTGPVGMRLTDRLDYFVSGVHYPDVVVFDPSRLAVEPDDASGGVRLVGFFGNDWAVESGDFAFAE
ncbi:MAG: alpha/beta hydrolase, partial [Planctomycetota bacterium]